MNLDKSRKEHSETRCNVLFYCKNGYVTGEAACFKGSLKGNVLYPAKLKKVKRVIGKKIAGHKPKFSYSDIVENEKLLSNLKEKQLSLKSCFKV